MNPDRSAHPPRMSGHHRRTYEAIFRHPQALNVEWHDVRSLLDAIGNVTEGLDGALTVSRNEHSVKLHAPEHKDIATEDLLAVRRFLERSGAALPHPKAEGAPAATGKQLLVVIDHHEAKVYHIETRGGPERLVPFDPHGFGRHLRSKTSTPTASGGRSGRASTSRSRRR